MIRQTLLLHEAVYLFPKQHRSSLCLDQTMGFLLPKTLPLDQPVEPVGLEVETEVVGKSAVVG